MAPAGQHLTPVTEWWDDVYDYVDFRRGDFSLVYQVEDEEEAGVFGFTPGPFIDTWDVSDQRAVALWLRVEGEAKRGAWTLALVDSSQRRAVAGLDEIQPDGRWYEVEIPLAQFDQEAGFQPSQLTSLQVEVDLATGSVIGFDDVRFVASVDRHEALGVSDKTIEQRLREARDTRAGRITAAFEETAGNDDARTLEEYFANLWLGRDLPQVNEELRRIFTTDDIGVRRQHGVHDDWSLSLNPLLIRMYFLFGSKSDIKPGRLARETEEALLELLWTRTREVNDIHLARQSTWWMIGSENHDINSKMAALLSSQIFKSEPEYADRVYPDSGTGGGAGYWFHQMYGQGTGYAGPPGEANWGDEKEYTAQEHYDAWVAFWNEYLTERARKGFFLEVASTGYMRHTIGFLLVIHDFSTDQALKNRISMFLDLVWAEWAQDQLGAVRGGAKTRWRYHGYDSMWEAARFYLGGPGNAEGWYGQLVSDYEWPEIVWRLALDRQGKGEFAYQSRKPGEEQADLWPRPDGLERTMAVDTEARFNRYSWVTPDYILGTQMDHPAALHSHLSTAARWQGMSFASDFQTSVSPCGIDTTDDREWQREKHAYYRSVQHEHVLITQQSRRWSQRNPDWYPSYSIYDKIFGVQFSGDYELLEEQKGWIFGELGKAFIAVRPVMGEYQYEHTSWSSTGNSSRLSDIREDAYEWGPDREFIILKDRYSPIIMEAGRRDEYGSMEEFQAHILSKRLELHKTVVPGWYIVVYGSDSENDTELYFNAANSEIPRVDGEYVDYEPDWVFDSPYMKSAYNAGVITLQVDGVQKVMDFRGP